jgi:hypothetical protein
VEWQRFGGLFIVSLQAEYPGRGARLEVVIPQPVPGQGRFKIMT